MAPVLILFGVLFIVVLFGSIQMIREDPMAGLFLLTILLGIAGMGILSVEYERTKNNSEKIERE